MPPSRILPHCLAEVFRNLHASTRPVILNALDALRACETFDFGDAEKAPLVFARAERVMIGDQSVKPVSFSVPMQRLLKRLQASV